MCGVGVNGGGRGETWFQKSGAYAKMSASEHTYEQYGKPRVKLTATATSTDTAAATFTATATATATVAATATTATAAIATATTTPATERPTPHTPHPTSPQVAYSEGRKLSMPGPGPNRGEASATPLPPPASAASAASAAGQSSGQSDTLKKSLRQIQLDVAELRSEPKSFRQPCTRDFLLDDWDSARRDSLARVLGAYAYRNEQPGYSQGMNFITLVFLASLRGDEEAAFWLLCTLVEDVRDVDFYADGSGSMNGFFADVMVTKHLAEIHLAELSEAMAEYEGDNAMEVWVCVYHTYLILMNETCWPATIRSPTHPPTHPPIRPPNL